MTRFVRNTIIHNNFRERFRSLILLSSRVSFSSCSFSSSASFAAFENGSGRNHGNLIIIIVIFTGAAAAAPPDLLRWSLGLCRNGLLARTADVLQRQKRRFVDELRTEEPSACRGPVVVLLPLCVRRGPFLDFGRGLDFLLAAFVLSSSSSLLSL